MKVGAVAGQINRLANKQTEETAKTSSFGDILSGQLNRIEETRNHADMMTQELVTGNTKDLHSVLAAAEEARITLEMALQVRNKAIDAYKEITNMQL